MAGRFPLLTDEHVSGPLLQGLARRGWDVQRGVDVFGQRTDDDVLFAYAAKEGRVFVSNDEPAEAIAIKWLNEGRPFRGVICWKQEHQGRMSVGGSFPPRTARSLERPLVPVAAGSGSVAPGRRPSPGRSDSGLGTVRESWRTQPAE